MCMYKGSDAILTLTNLDLGFGIFHLNDTPAKYSICPKIKKGTYLKRVIPPPLPGLEKSCWLPIPFFFLFPSAAKLLDQFSQLGQLSLQLPNF